MEEWNAIDLHMHTVAGITGDGGKDEIKHFTYSNYLYSLKKYDIKLAATTNHNLIDITNFILLKYLSNKCGINLLLGVELDADTELGDNYHFVCIFDEPDLLRCIKLSNDINCKATEKKKTGKVRFTGSEVIDIIKNYNTIIVPHGDKNKGIFEDYGNEEKIKIALKKVKDGFVKVFDNSPSDWKSERLKSFLSSSNIFKNIDEFGGVLFSDNRDWLNYGKKCKNFYMNAEPTFKGFLHSITNPVQRFTIRDYIPQKTNYISKMVIKAKNNEARIAEGTIYFSSGYNCIIGKSGSGKSLLLYLIRKKLLQIPDDNNYGFIENNEISFYDEKGSLINPLDLNIGVGEGIIDKILSVSSSKDGNDMYKVISLLKKDFKPRVKFDNFVAKYRYYLSKYSQEKEIVRGIKEKCISQLNVFKQETEELIKLKDIVSFSTIEIKKDEEYKYSSVDLFKICSIDEQIKVINESMKSYDKDDFNDLEIVFNLFRDAYYKKNKEIYSDYSKMIYNNRKKQILRESLGKVNKGISSNAEKKTLFQNGMDARISSIVKSLKNYYLINKALDKFDLSINPSNIDSSTTPFADEDIEITENIDKTILTNFDIRNNEIFYLHGIRTSLIQRTVDMTDRNSALKVINEYYEKGALTIDKINKFFEKNSILNVDVFFDKQNVKKLNPGSIAKTYIDLYFNTKLNNGNYTVILYDQIENDVDKEFIKDDIVKHISKMKDKGQIIIVTHDPIVAVNADPTNYIISSKDVNGIINYRNFVAESSATDELVTIANTVDGSKYVIKKRYDIYKGESDYVD